MVWEVTNPKIHRAIKMTAILSNMTVVLMLKVKPENDVVLQRAKSNSPGLGH
jgi:hypothetical protein